MNRFWAAAMVLALALVTAGCAGGRSGRERPLNQTAEASAADVVIVAKDVAFVDPPREIRTGALTIALDNRGHSHHDITFQGIRTVASASGQSQVAGQVTLEPGTYVVFCSVPGHRTAGMKFEVAVI